MRFLFALLALPLFAMPVQAETAAAPKAVRAHTTMQQRFEQANVTHDGHLTQDQAKQGYRTVARHFAAIDRDHKGYVTEDDIKAYLKAQRALHHQSASSRHQPNS
jgi:hypothetical protein